MRVLSKNKGKNSAKPRLFTASIAILEPMEKRMLMSTGSIITAWSFDNNQGSATGGQPVPSTGSGTAASVGMTSAGSTTAYPYATTGATPGSDGSALSSATGTSDSSSGNETWKIAGAGALNGWNNTAGIATQGVQFMASTAQNSLVNVRFDFLPSSKGEQKLLVEYTTNSGGSWNDAIISGSNVSNTNVTNLPSSFTIVNNSTGSLANTFNGYFLNYSTGGSTWANAVSIDLSGISAAQNDSGFGIRLVNAAKGTADTTASAGAVENNTSGNWSFDEVDIDGVSAIPNVSTNPVAVTQSGGNSVTFTAVASASPVPIAEWQVSIDGGMTYNNISTGVSSNTSTATTTTYTFAASPSLNGDLFRAQFSNAYAVSNSSGALLMVPTTTPLIISQPSPATVSTQVTVPVTLTAAAYGSDASTTTAQWEVNQSGGGFAPVASNGTNYNSTNGVSTYTFTPTEEDAGDEFEVIFTTGSYSTTSTYVPVSVLAVPISDWTLPSQQTSPVEYPQPAPAIGTGSAIPIGMGSNGSSDFNDYTGVQSFAEDDITGTAGTADPDFTANLWRIRGGSGAGATGSPGSPEGWSSEAPALQAVTYQGNTYQPQGAEWMTSTVGYNNVVVNFQWYTTGSGMKYAQPQYTTDGGNTWINYTPTGPGNSGTTAQYTLVAGEGDYYSANPQNATNPPTGVTLDFSNSAFSAVNNNPNFGVRLVAAYDPNLPQINDGNPLVAEPHGQYATATPGAANTSQQLVIDGASVGGTFNLSLGSLTTGPITWAGPASQGPSAYTTIGGVFTSETAINIAAALNALTGITGVTVLTMDSTAVNFTVTFTSAQANVLVPNNISLGGGATIAETYAGADVPYTIAGQGNWRFGNIDITGDVTSGAPGAISEPSNQTATLASGIYTANPPGPFISTAHSQTPITSYTYWEQAPSSSSPDTNPWLPVSDPSDVQLTQNGNAWTLTYAASATSTSQSGTNYEAVFNNAGGTATSNPATLIVVIPVLPSVSSQPNSTSAIYNHTAVFTASATGLPDSFNSGGGSTVWYQQAPGSTTWTAVSVNAAGTNVSTGSAMITSGTFIGDYLTTSTLTLNANVSSGFSYMAKFSNEIGFANSSAAVLTVLPVEPAATQWNFSGFPTSGTGGYNNNPAATTNLASGSLTSLGFDDPNFGQPVPLGNGSGTPSVTADDVTASSGTLNTAFSENTWRVRGGQTATGGGAPDNGWDAYAPEYSQGIEIDVNTTGYNSLYLTYDWVTTAQAVRDLQEQYNLNTSNPNGWTNITNGLLVAPNGGDFYGATANAPTGALVDLTSISGASDDANFGIRLVAAYDPALPMITDSPTIQDENNYTLPEPHGQYASATLVNGSPTPLNGSSGNWRFGNITLYGVYTPTWLSPASLSSGYASFNQSNHVLTVTGPTTIIADPGNDEPIIDASGPTAIVTVAPTTGTTVNIGGLNLTNHASVVMSSTASDILVIQAGGPVNIDSTSKLDLGKGFADFQATNASQGTSIYDNVMGLINSGYNNGQWNGAGGIISTGATTDASHLTALGEIVNDYSTPNGLYGASGNLGSFDGFNPGANDVLVRYTYYGDANLDGTVDGTDYSLIDSAYTTAGLTGWGYGDFNYDSSIDGSDYTLIDNAYNTQAGDPLALIASPDALPTARIATVKSTPKTTGKTSPFATGRQIGTYVPPLPAATSTIADLLKHDKKNILAGSLLDAEAEADSGKIAK